MLILLKEDKKPIKIEPIKIVSLSENQKTSSKKRDKEKPLDILSRLEAATKVSTEGVVSSEEEVSHKVLESLKKSLAKQ